MQPLLAGGRELDQMVMETIAGGLAEAVDYRILVM
jgi:hypothetical protein